ncbi:Valine--tRNA ligase [subsurface metagenome]
MEKKLNKINNELNLIFKKINNKDFLSRAPEDIVKKERDKADDLRDIKERLENSLKTFK